MATVWERRFPPLGPATSKSVAVRSTTPPVGGPHSIVGPRVRPVTRGLAAVVTPGGAVRVPTPQEALQAAFAAQYSVLDYSSTSIRPGTSSRAPGQGSREGDGRSPSPGGEGRSRSPIPLEHGRASPTRGFGQDHAGAAPSGYERMEATIERVHARIDRVPLDERWRLMAAWLDRFYIDQGTETLLRSCCDVYGSVSERLGTRESLSLSTSNSQKVPSGPPPPQGALRQSTANVLDVLNRSAEGTDRMPNGIRTATSMMMLEQLLHLLCRYAPTVAPAAALVRDDVLSAIYYSYPRADINHSFEPLSFPPTVEQQQRLISRYYTKTFYQQLRDERRLRSKSNEEQEHNNRQRVNQMNVMNRAVAYWQNYSISRLFRAWRHVTVEAKESRLLQSKRSEAESHAAEVEAALAERDEQMKAMSVSHEAALIRMRREVAKLTAQLAEKTKEAAAWQAKCVELAGVNAENLPSASAGSDDPTDIQTEPKSDAETLPPTVIG